jgi:hypothetical protein
MGLISFKKVRCMRGSKVCNNAHICSEAFLSIFVDFILSFIKNRMSILRIAKKGLKLSVLTAALLFSYTDTYAQWGWGEETEESDTTENNNSFGDFGGDEGPRDEKGTPPKPIVKYERIENIPVDTLTKLITYTAVHDVESNCEYCTADSLYFRAKNYLLKKFGDGKKFPKEWIVEDAVNQRIILKVRSPLMIEPNPHTLKREGDYEYRFQLWIRDFAYKYKFTSFVHQDPVVAGKPGTFTPVYAEFYLKNKTKVRFTDMILLAIDRDMKKLIEELVLIMKDPVTVDIDEEDF